MQTKWYWAIIPARRDSRSPPTRAVSYTHLVTSIGNAIFIGGKVSSIEVDAENTAYYSVDGVLFKDNILMQYPPCKPDEEYTLPENITGINSQAMTHTPVSYTHLDVYKRQLFMWLLG